MRNKRKIISSLKYANDVVDAVKEYTDFMDIYFKKEENKEIHKELYMCYDNFIQQLKIKARQRGLIDE